MATGTPAPAEKEFRSARKLLSGTVASAKMNKTRVIEVKWQSTHPQYQKVLRRSSHFYAHDEKNESQLGDRVEIAETRPMSKLKRWRITRIVEKAK